MAEDKEQQDNQLAKELATGASGGQAKVAIWVLLGVGIMAVFACSGFVVGSLMKSTPEKPKVEAAPAAEGEGAKAGGHESGDKKTATGDGDYFKFEPFTATLNTERRDRFLVCTLVLKLRPGESKKATELLEKKKIELQSKISLYLNSQSLEDVTGKKNLNRMLREVQDMVNQHLWPTEKPMVIEVLMPNSAIQ